jgi:hypothetical protein
MYSEKLKQLIKDKVPLKFRIKDEQQSKELQEFLFAMDVGWGRWKEITYVDSPFLFVGDQLDQMGKYRLLHAPVTEIFDSYPAQEFDLKHDCLAEEIPIARTSVVTDGVISVTNNGGLAQEDEKKKCCANCAHFDWEYPPLYSVGGWSIPYCYRYPKPKQLKYEAPEFGTKPTIIQHVCGEHEFKEE